LVIAGKRLIGSIFLVIIWPPGGRAFVVKPSRIFASLKASHLPQVIDEWKRNVH
jgi:hypothetical protein